MDSENNLFAENVIRKQHKRIYDKIATDQFNTSITIELMYMSFCS